MDPKFRWLALINLSLKDCKILYSKTVYVSIKKINVFWLITVTTVPKLNKHPPTT